MKKYIYRNKKTGKKIYSDEIIKDNKDLVLVSAVKDMQMKSSNIVQKFWAGWANIKGRKPNK